MYTLKVLYLTESTASLTCGNREILKAITLPGGKESKYTSLLPSLCSTRTNYEKKKYKSWLSLVFMTVLYYDWKKTSQYQEWQVNTYIRRHTCDCSTVKCSWISTTWLSSPLIKSELLIYSSVPTFTRVRPSNIISSIFPKRTRKRDLFKLSKYYNRLNSNTLHINHVVEVWTCWWPRENL